MSNEPTIQDIYYKLGGLESKIDSVLAIQHAEAEYNLKRLEDLENVVKTLSNKTSRLEMIEAKRTGMLVVITGIMSIVGAAVVKFITTNLHFG